MHFRPLLHVVASLFLAVPLTQAGDFAGTAGLQLYSFREAFKKDVPGTLDKVKELGFKEVETASLYGMPAEKLASMLKERGLTPVSGHFQYGQLKSSLPEVIQQAKALGLKYVACPWIPHPEAGFDEAICREAAKDFNAWGAALKAEGLTFAYHPHGYEFVPAGEGTLFDLLMTSTTPEAVSFEMDVFWIMHPGQDPVKLLEKYPNRWVLMHLKDIRKGARTGVPSGHAPLTDDVAIGTGMVDWPAVLRTAAKVGVKHYFIEDESPVVETQVPESLKYLRSLQ